MKVYLNLKGAKIMIYFKVFILLPTILAVLFHIPNFIHILFKNHKLDQGNNGLKKIGILIYSIIISSVFITALFQGFYTGLGSVKPSYHGILYIMYLISFFLIYFLQYLILKYSNNYLLSAKGFRIIFYLFALIISVFTYGYSPISELKILKEHLIIWNNTVTSVIIFDVLFFMIVLKQND